MKFAFEPVSKLATSFLRQRLDIEINSKLDTAEAGGRLGRDPASAQEKP
jgi:hypothetical protein